MFLDYLSSLPGHLSQGLIWAIAAIGIYITYKVLDIPDLTVDGSFATGNIVAAVLINAGVHFALAMLIAFAAGLLCGLITGLLHTLIGIPPILAGILTQMGLWSINLLIAGQANVALLGNPQLLVNQIDPLNSLWILAIVFVVIIGLLYVFFGTELGASIRATGNNQDMARAQGINTKFNIVLGLMISNGLVALAGSLLTQYFSFGDIGNGQGAIVIGLCAVVIGTAIVKKISPNFLLRLAGVGIGSIIYFIIYSAVSFIGLDTTLLKLIAAVVVIIFLGIPYVKRVYGGKIKKRISDSKLSRGSNK